ncbi:flagellar hook-basal body complex protein FliE [bacterium DOLJORAL78_65_58]|nr:MAG: flagellar hook-basal body complex protein FliE [bacterium DOLZORAL124_64_63]PIE76240.1 MAG: flagellar hook-basal body complex protein FliE [bacterium DOLJORAL78_65_58]
MSIGSIKSLGSINPGAAYGVGRATAKPTANFADQLQKAIREVDNLQAGRDQMVEGMVSGEVTEVHDVMIAAKEAQLAFELLLEVRNKLLEGYQEIMRLQV